MVEKKKSDHKDLSSMIGKGIKTVIPGVVSLTMLPTMTGKREMMPDRASVILQKASNMIYDLMIHVPDIVIKAERGTTNPFVQHFFGVLIFADISGFTALSERMRVKGAKGIDTLTKIVNAFIGAIVDEILTCKGDVLEFAGDAILGSWRIIDRRDTPHLVARAVKCSLNIQEKYGLWDTGEGVVLKVKFGISVGDYHITYLGNEETQRYNTMGPAVDDCNEAEHLCGSGDVVVSGAVWEQLKQTKYTSSVPDPNQPFKRIDAAESLTYSLYEEKEDDIFLEETTSYWEFLKEKGISESKREGFLVPKTIELEEELRLFILPPVVRKLDEEQPLEFLSEMREVTIVFINLELDESFDQPELMQQAFQVIYVMSKLHKGLLNKVFTFDKGCTFLEIYGLPGFKQDNDCANALQCAYETFNALEKVDGVDLVSIGVTTGNAYCGVVGHTLRCEYTVIGRKVNAAARLMMNYKGQLTCDKDTFLQSRLPHHNFTKLPDVELKGLRRIGQIYEYSEKAQKEVIRESEYPILGRETEMARYSFLLDEYKNNFNDPIDILKQVIVFSGETGIGKTRVIQEAIEIAHGQDIRVVPSVLNMQNLTMPNFALASLLTSLFKFNTDQAPEEKEKIILKYLKIKDLRTRACCLNELLSLNFRTTADYAQMDAVARAMEIKSFAYTLINEIMDIDGIVIMFVIDNGQFLDSDSWKFILDLGNETNALCTLSLLQFAKKELLDKSGLETLTRNNTEVIELAALDDEYMLPLACQILDVVAINKDLIK